MKAIVDILDKSEKFVCEPDLEGPHTLPLLVKMASQRRILLLTVKSSTSCHTAMDQDCKLASNQISAYIMSRVQTVLILQIMATVVSNKKRSNVCFFFSGDPELPPPYDEEIFSSFFTNM